MNMFIFVVDFNFKIMEIIKYFKYTLKDITEFLSLEDFRFYRCFCGGIWYKHDMSGELPNCYGSFGLDMVK